MPLGTKELFDTMLAAAEAQDLAALRKHTEEFLEDSRNFSRCTDSNGDTVLHKALAPSTAVLAFVIDELQADVNAQNALGKTALHEAAKANFVAAAELLIDRGADVMLPNEVGSTPFHTACSCGSVAVMEVLLKQEEVSPDLVDGTGSFPVHKCSFDGDEHVFSLLLKHGASVDTRDTLECTPVHVAVKMNRIDFVRKLLAAGEEQGFDINTGDKSGNTLLHGAVARCLHEIVTLLLDKGADINKANEDGNTPLHVAAQCLQPDMCEWEDLVVDLLRRGADHTATNELSGRASGMKPVDYVSRNAAYLFDPAEYKRRDEEVAKKKEAEEKVKAALDEEKNKYKEEIRRTHKERERVRREVLVQRQKDEEERQVCGRWCLGGKS
ncbi:Ankyrin repeat [Diplonema papillatum]|nr:Ankyrin repeat [Diplonema papillatum]